MHFSLNIEDYIIRAFGFSSNIDFENAVRNGSEFDVNAKNPKPTKIPMLYARRLSSGCRLAVDAGLILADAHEDIDAVIYSSRSGEIEHNFRVLDAIARNQPCSPTDFSMSVHNCGVGNFTILSKKKIPSTSISAGTDSFMQALTEAYSMLSTRYNKILLVDYEVTIPQFFKLYLDEKTPTYPYSVGLILTRGNEVKISTSKRDFQDISDYPPAITFLKHLILGHADFSLPGHNLRWDVKF